MKRIHVLITILAALVVVLLLFTLFFKTPSGFKPETVISVVSGETVTTIATHLREQHLITSPFWFTNLIILRHGEKKITAGDYIFHSPENLFSVARRFTTADFQLTTIKTTIPEGSSIYDIAEIMSKKFADFDPVDFLSKAKSEEGYLFPDTYFLFATVKPEVLITTLKDNFKQKTDPLLPEVAKSGRSFKDIVILASLLEAEAKTTKDRELIAGIFLKRISLGMKLQSDAPFRYINGKTTNELTVKDLQIDSPYNTYRYPGLPPGAISNPGLDALNAAIHPVASKYLYFLSDNKDGTVHYAATFAEHQKNVKKYLR